MPVKVTVQINGFSISKYQDTFCSVPLTPCSHFLPFFSDQVSTAALKAKHKLTSPLTAPYLGDKAQSTVTATAWEA